MSDSDSGASKPLNRLFVVALVAVGLVIAAFALPAVDSSAGAGGGGGGEVTPPDGSGEPRSVEWDLPINWVPEEGVELLIRGGERLVVTQNGEGGERYQGCAVVITEEPTPGSEVPIIVWNEGDAAADVPVWFDGELQGRTDADGRVVGTVSYSGELDIEVSVPGAETCVFVLDGEIVGRGESTEASAGGPAGSLASMGQSLSLAPGGDKQAAATAGFTGTARGSGGQTATAATQTGGNYSTSVPVEGQISIAIRGDPYPGDEVDIRATIEGEEVPDATVSVAGEQQTETDRAGRATVRLPNDGSEQTTITVRRGDFSGSAAVDLLVADIAVVPAGPLPLPGDDAAVRVTIGDRTVSNTTVHRNGTALGVTGPDGRLATTMPVDPLTTYSTTVRGQTATTHAVWAYLPTIVGGLVLVGLFAGSLAAAGIGGKRWFVATVAAWVAFSASVAGYVLGGRRGLAIAAGSLAVVYLGIALVVYRKRAAAGAKGGGRRLRSLGRRLLAWLGRRSPGEWVKHVAVRIAGVLGRIGSAIVERIRGHSVRSGLRAIVAIPGRVLRGFGRYGRRLVTAVHPVVLAGGVAFVGVLTGVAYYLVGPRAAAGAAVAATGVVVLVGLVVAVLRGDEDEETAAQGQSTTARAGPTAAGSEREKTVTLRRLWRTVAQWVLPGQWQSRTPGEIARAAIERGYPEQPVEELTRVFRDVEYGDRPMTPDRWEASTDAFRQLLRAHTDTEEEHDEQT